MSASHSGNITPLVLAERHLDNPRRKRAKVSLVETLSFINYVNAHKIAGTTHLFGRATERGAGFTAVLDYHDVEQTPVKNAPADGSEPTVSGGTGKVLAHFGEHVATLELVVTPEWSRWVDHNSKLMPQEQFAEFIEENLNDIVHPHAADVLEMAQGLQGRRDVAFKSGKNLRDGAINLEYTETITLQGTTNRRDDSFRMPDKMTLGIVPFVGASGIEIEARIRFRIDASGKLFFAYVLNRPYKVIEEAFTLARSEIEERTGIDVALGSAAITSA